MRPGNRPHASVALSGRPGNRQISAAVVPTAQAVALQAQVAATQVQAASADSFAISEDDIGSAVQAYNEKLAKLATGEVVTGTRTVAGSAAVGDGDDLLLVDASAGAATIGLPSATATGGRQVTVKKIDASANAVTVDPAGTETIDGAATFVLAAQNDAVTIKSDGTEWFKL